MRKKSLQRAGILRDFVRDIIYWVITGRLGYQLGQVAIQGCNTILSSFSKVEDEEKLAEMQKNMERLEKLIADQLKGIRPTAPAAAEKTTRSDA